MKNFDYITNYLPGQKAAKLSIKRPIDKDGAKGINGDDFAKEMDFLAEVGVEEVIIEINSIGGSIKEGFSIFSAIKDAPFKTVFDGSQKLLQHFFKKKLDQLMREEPNT